MLTLVELKRILFKAPVFVIICFVLPLYVAAGFLVGVSESKTDYYDYGTSAPMSITEAITNFKNNSSCDYHNIKLRERLDKQIEQIEQHNPDFDYAADLLYHFKVFLGSDDTEGGYLGLFYYTANETTDVALLGSWFSYANRYFWQFSDHLDEYTASLKRVLFSTGDYETLMHAVELLRECFNYPPSETFTGGQYLFQFFKEKRETIADIWFFESGDVIEVILSDAENLDLTVAQQEMLIEIYNTEIVDALSDSYADVIYSETLDEFSENLARYDSLCNTAADCLELRLRQMRSENEKVFLNLFGSTLSTDIETLEMLIENRKASFDYSDPFTFKSVMHEPTGTTVYDFVFNCFEIIAIPLLIFAIVIVVFCIYDDIAKRTVYQTLVSPQGRKRIIGAKLLAIMWSVALLMGIFFVLFFITATIMLGPVAPPTVLTVFAGKVITISPLTLLLVHVFSLFFKILFFAAWTAYICLNASTMSSIFFRIIPYTALVLLFNYFFSMFVFWQFVPLLALEFSQYFGVKPMMLWKAVPHYNMLFTVPLMLAILSLMIYSTIKRFNRRDF